MTTEELITLSASILRAGSVIGYNEAVSLAFSIHKDVRDRQREYSATDGRFDRTAGPVPQEKKNRRRK